MKNKMTELDGFFPRTIGSCHPSAGAELARDGGVFLVRVASAIWAVLLLFICCQGLASAHDFWLQILHSQISTIEKQATTATGCPLLIRCKNFQLLQLIIPQERDCHDVYISLIRLARPGRAEELSSLGSQAVFKKSA